MELTQKDRAAISRRVAYALSLCEEDCSGTEVLSRLYCEFMPGKTGYQGQMMAMNVMERVADFEAHYAAAQEAPRDYAASQLEALIDARASLEDQCRMLYAIAQSLELFNEEAVKASMTAEDPEVFLRGMALDVDSAPYQGEVSEQRRKVLFQQALSAIEDRRIPEKALEQMRERISKGESAAYASALARNNEAFFSALTAMTIYTLAKAGELEGAPAELTIDQAAVFACCESYTSHIQEQLERGRISTEKARRRLTQVWTVTRVLLAAALAVGAAALVFAAHNTLAAGVVLVGAFMLAGLLMGPIDRTVKRMLERASLKIGAVSMKLPDRPNAAVTARGARAKTEEAPEAAAEGGGMDELEELPELEDLNEAERL